ncbi:penicillin-binding transpeptidase domain-containing protein [Ornithobacterium rhinotracheale]|uniref:peptidoglycan D,D-transpeptidase FtsI family protein n=1 Tax=Ornithobacterium rhinotracheale TaxID=28251 RepID=UPI00387399B8
MKRTALFYFLIIAISLSFIARLAYLQLFTDRYILNAFNTSIKREIIYPKRGDILDRNGKLLVTNSWDYELQITPLLLEKGFDTIQFCKLIGISREEFDQKMAEIKAIKGYTKVGTFTLIKGINREDFTRFQEQMYKYPAIDVVQKPKREYRVSGGGNVLGYIQEVSPSYIKKDSSYYDPGDLAGMSGVEKSYEKVLRGKKGFKYLKKDIRLRTIGAYENGDKDVQVENGKVLNLSIDYDLQEYAESLLQNKRGAIVAIEPKTGEILALASSPSIDPRRYNVPGEISRMMRDSINKIMYDRALQAAYPPGSPFKILTGLSAFQLGVADSAKVYTCHHGFYYGRSHMNCHCGRGALKIETAIERSCNSYFSKAWIDILKKDSINIEHSIDDWADIMHSFGLGKFLGTDMPVGSKGNIPTSKYYNRFLGKGKWNPYSVVSNGIGQGEILLTPIQMANFAAAVANKGYYYTPHIVKKIDGEPLHDTLYTKKHYVKVDPKLFPPFLKGMEYVFSRAGTARAYYSKRFTQAGKTGTSQVSQGPDHSLFVIIAPVENPKIVVAVVVENGVWGARWAAPIASLVAEKYLFGEVEKGSRKSLENRMIKGDLTPTYRKMEIDRLKRLGWYVEPPKVDSLAVK